MNKSKKVLKYLGFALIHTFLYGTLSSLIFKWLKSMNLSQLNFFQSMSQGYGLAFGIIIGAIAVFMAIWVASWLLLKVKLHEKLSLELSERVLARTNLMTQAAQFSMDYILYSIVALLIGVTVVIMMSQIPTVIGLGINFYIMYKVYSWTFAKQS